MEEEEKEQEEKTEEASEERRKQFREEGQIVNPREIVHSFTLLLFIMLFYFLGTKIFLANNNSFNSIWHSLSPSQVTMNNLNSIFYNAVKAWFPIMAQIFVILILSPIFLGLLLTNFNWIQKNLAFNFNKLNPLTGFMRMFSLQILPELIKNLAKIIILGIIAYIYIKDLILKSNQYLAIDLKHSLFNMLNLLFKISLNLAIASFIIGLVDFGWNWWKIERKMKMTKKEVKDEVKSQEGDPHVKQARRRMGREFSMQKAIQQVPKASFIVTNPEHFAIAVKYNKNLKVPIIVAKGMDFLALRIKEIAKKNDIIIIENKPLARTLYKTVKIGQEIPSSLFSSIIEVMRHIQGIKGADYFDKQNN